VGALRQAPQCSDDQLDPSFKSYDQGRVAFQGTSQDIVWLDEEPSDPAGDPDGRTDAERQR
jgi:phage terminase large subunit-like protein